MLNLKFRVIMNKKIFDYQIWVWTSSCIWTYKDQVTVPFWDLIEFLFDSIAMEL